MVLEFLPYIFVLVLIPLAVAQAAAFTIEGTISFTNQGDIHVYLVTEEVFKTPLTGIQTLQLKIGPTGMLEKEVSFVCEEVGKNIYGIRCFQDVNGNVKLDRGIGGPAEPWGMSWQSEKPKRWPRFSHRSFKVEQDISNLYIELQ